MSTKTIGIVLVIVVLAGIGGYAVWSMRTDETATVENTNDSTNTTNNDKKIAFTELMKQGGTYKCEVNQYVGDTATKGTVYMDKDRLSGRYDSQAQGMNISSYFIVRDGYTYVWSSAMQGMGYKMRAQANATAPGNAGAPASNSYSFNAETIGDYSCEAWTADSSKFELPAGVTFNEM